MNNALETLNHRWGRVKEFINYTQPKDFWIDINDYLRKLTKGFIEDTLDEEMIQYMQTQPYQRTNTRVDYRNGHYYRDLDTTIGPIEKITVPRSRLGLFKPTIFEHYQRRQQAVNAGTLKPILGTSISASGVSRITKSLNSKVKEFHSRPLIDEYQFLFLDGIAISVKGSLKAKKILVLVAYGITLFGKKELIAFNLAHAESNSACEGFLNDLFNRGLKGNHLKLIITDGSKGFANAIDLVYPHSLHQRCWVHKLRNIAKYIKKADQKIVLNHIKNIYKAKTHREAVAVFKSVQQTWQHKYPKVVKSIEQDLDPLLAFLTIPIKKEHRDFIRRQIRTTNVIERSLREVRRRTRPMGCFTNNDSVSRIIYAIFCKLNSNWNEKPLKQFTQFI